MARSKKVPFSERGSLTKNEAMKFAGIGHRKAKALITAKEWRAYRNGREIRVITASIVEWMEREAEKFQKAS